jgi:hypothetical protein
LLYLFCCWPSLSLAQENKRDSLSVNAKIDSIYQLQKKIYAEIKNQPLINKKVGIEFNFVRLLLIEDAFTLSGGLSFFSVNRQAEIAFPIYYCNPKDPKDLKEWTIDCHYRYFLGNTQNGFYLSGFTRYAHLSGYAGNNDDLLWEGSTDGQKLSEDKIGIGVGIGYRKFSYKGLYWGFSFSFGKFITGEQNKFFGKFLALDDDAKYIYDCEILKFGWAF